MSRWIVFLIIKWIWFPICNAQNSIRLLDQQGLISSNLTSTSISLSLSPNINYAAFPTNETILSISMNIDNDTTSHVLAMLMDETGHILGTITREPLMNSNANSLATTATACFDVTQTMDWWLKNYTIVVTGKPGVIFRVTIYAVNTRLPIMSGDTIISAASGPNLTTNFTYESTSSSYVRTYYLMVPQVLDDIGLIEIRAAAVGDVSIEQPTWLHVRSTIDSEGQPRECPTPQNIILPDAYSSRLTWDKYGVFVLSKQSHPPLIPGGTYIIGIQKIQPTPEDLIFADAPQIVFQSNTAKKFSINVIAISEYSASSTIALFAIIPIVTGCIMVLSFVWLMRSYKIWKPFPWSPEDYLTHASNPYIPASCCGCWKRFYTRFHNSRIFRPRDPRMPYSFNWHLLMVAMAFFVGAFQYVWSQRDTMLTTGNRDICFYNDRCYRPSPWHDLPFNNMISNVPYVGLGLIFLLFVYLDEEQNRPDVHNALFYAIGIALIGEGIFSTTYHICPTPIIYQFDTACMFAIAIMCILSLNQTGEWEEAELEHGLEYQQQQQQQQLPQPQQQKNQFAKEYEEQKQNPSSPPSSTPSSVSTPHKLDRNVTFRSVKVFLFVYIVLLFLNAGGTVESTNRTGIIVAICIIELIWISYIMYNFYIASETRRKLSFAVLAYYIMCLILTILFAVGKGGPAIDSIANLLLIQLVFALCMTTCASIVVRRSRIMGPTPFPEGHNLSRNQRVARAVLLLAIPGFLGAGSFAAGYSFFSRHTSNKAILPHQSRNDNSDCVSSILDFHDIWHILSGIGLFFLFILFYMINPPFRRATKSHLIPPAATPITNSIDTQPAEHTLISSTTTATGTIPPADLKSTVDMDMKSPVDAPLKHDVSFHDIHTNTNDLHIQISEQYEPVTFHLSPDN